MSEDTSRLFLALDVLEWSLVLPRARSGKSRDL